MLGVNVLVQGVVVLGVAGWCHCNVRSSISVVTSGVSAASTSESKVTGPDGITTGHCTYTDSQGHSVKINYKESPSGQILSAQTDAKHINDAKHALKKCRESAAEAEAELTKNMEEHQKIFDEQEEQFKKQREEFDKQQKEFEAQMEDMNKQLMKMFE